VGGYLDHQMTVTRAAARRARRNNNATLESREFFQKPKGAPVTCTTTRGIVSPMGESKSTTEEKSLGRCTNHLLWVRLIVRSA
jgi:hypothetical protein